MNGAAADPLTGADTLAWFAKRGAKFCKVSAHNSTGGSPGKKPIVKDWPNKPEDLATITPHLKRGNVGLLCGDHSNGLILLDVDKEAQAFLSQFPYLATAPAVIRDNAPDKIKIVVRIKDGAPRGRKFFADKEPIDTKETTEEEKTKTDDKEPSILEVLSQSNQGVIAGTHTTGATLKLINANNPIPIYTKTELDDLCYVWCGRGLFDDPKEPAAPKPANIPQHQRPENTEDDLLSAVENAWTPLDVFKHFDMVTTTRKEPKGMTRLLGNGGLFVHEDGKRWCQAGQLGVGGGVFQAWTWAKTGRATCKTPTGRAFYDLLLEMAGAASIDVSKFQQKTAQQPTTPPEPEWPPEPEYTATPDTQPTPGAAAANQNNSADPWVIRTLADAFRPRLPADYIVGKLFRVPSLNIVYGAPGTLKSFLLADLMVCVAAGIDWLPYAPHQGGGNGAAVTQRPVFWIDFDNGPDVTDDRFAALIRGHNLPVTTPINYVSMPSPRLDTTNIGSVGRLIIRARDLGAKLIVIDNLSNISGGADENSGEMIKVMDNLKQIAEDTGAAVVVVHHQRKGNGDKTGRDGDTLRGHSSIEASLYQAVKVEREDYSDTIKIRTTKNRGAEVLPFGGLWTFDDDDTGELFKARFYGLKVEDLQSGMAIETAIMNALYGTTLNKTDLVAKVKPALSGVGVNRIRERIDRMAAAKQLRMTPGAKNNETLYTRP